MRSKYSYRVFESIDEVDQEAWRTVHEAVGDPFTDLRFLEVFEQTLGSQLPFRLILFYDEAETPIGITCISLCNLDVATMVSRRMRSIVKCIRQVWSAYLRFDIALCGLPVTVPQQKLCILPHADRSAVIVLLHEALQTFANDQRVKVMLIGDFDKEDCQELSMLVDDFGYVQGDSEPMHHLHNVQYQDLDAYTSAMRCTHRKKIRYEQRRCDSDHVRFQQVTTGSTTGDWLSEEDYAIYLQLLERVDFHLATLPRDFFNQFCDRFQDDIHLVRAIIDDEAAGFGLGMFWNGTYYCLFLAVDAQLNQRYRTYFNLVFQRLDHALKRGVNEVNLGTTADTFKLSLGSKPTQRQIFVKARGIWGWLLRAFSPLLLPKIEALKPYRVFRESATPIVPPLTSASVPVESFVDE